MTQFSRVAWILNSLGFSLLICSLVLVPNRSVLGDGPASDGQCPGVICNSPGSAACPMQYQFPNCPNNTSGCDPGSGATNQAACLRYCQCAMFIALTSCVCSNGPQ